MQEDEELAAVTTLDAKDLILTDIKIPPPLTLAEPEREALVKSSLTRIWSGGDEMSLARSNAGGGGQELWMLLIIRMVTRVVDPDPDIQMQNDTAEEDSEEVKDAKMVTLYERQDKLRRTLCDYIMTDFSGRCVFLYALWSQKVPFLIEF